MKTIAQEFVGQIQSDPTGGDPYFGKDQPILNRMKDCARRGAVAVTNFHYNQGDCTAPGCPMP